MKDKLEMSSMMCFKEGAINWQKQPTGMNQGHILIGDALGNPAHALLSPHAQDKELGKTFLKWMVWSRGGQEVIRTFKVNGISLHGLSPCLETFFGGQDSAIGDQSSGQTSAQNDSKNADMTGTGNVSHADLPTSVQRNIDAKYWII